jgi:tRNA C32,U32 (ribose-2'-O)-methylase TrmJ
VTHPGVADPPILVLVEPQDLVNIASAIRVAKNFGLTDVRLVNPREFDAWRVEGIAHNTGDILARLRITATLDERWRTRPMPWRSPRANAGRSGR